MADLNIRDVDDDVKQITDELARAQNMSTSAYIRLVLEQNAETERRRRGMCAADERIARVRSELDNDRKMTSTGAQLIREVRQEYERHAEEQAVEQ